MIFNIILCAVLFRVLGGGFGRYLNDVPRIYPVSAMVILIALNSNSILELAAFLWFFFVVRILATHGKFSAIHGQEPDRISNIIDKWFMPKIKHFRNWKQWGILYGAIRASLAIPAMFVVGGWLFLLQGVLYWACGIISQRHAVMIAELIAGFYFGLILGGF
jgi:hypothetical protein